LLLLDDVANSPAPPAAAEEEDDEADVCSFCFLFEILFGALIKIS
jgi:hypothetical protein